MDRVYPVLFGLSILTITSSGDQLPVQSLVTDRVVAVELPGSVPDADPEF
jgi:hypothetical protein